MFSSAAARSASALDSRYVREPRISKRSNTVSKSGTGATKLLDHSLNRCSKWSLNAVLRRFEADGPAWKPEWVCYYDINDSVPPSFVVDVSDHYETKRRALASHVSQFRPAAPDAVPTRRTAATFSQLIESRDAKFGALAGVAIAEGIVVREPVVRRDLLRN